MCMASFTFLKDFLKQISESKNYILRKVDFRGIAPKIIIISQKACRQLGERGGTTSDKVEGEAHRES